MSQGFKITAYFLFLILLIELMWLGLDHLAEHDYRARKQQMMCDFLIEQRAAGRTRAQQDPSLRGWTCPGIFLKDDVKEQETTKEGK